MTNDERHHAPSDLELMLYFDGELDEPRKSEVAAFVNADLRSQNKLAGLRITSALVGAQAQEIATGPTKGRSPADDIADLVLAKIQAEGPFSRTTSGNRSRTEPAEAPEAKIIPFPVRSTSDNRSSKSSGSTTPARAPARRETTASRSRPANDYARRIVGVAALAVAAAAALAIWGKQAAGPGAPSGQVAQTAPSSTPASQGSSAPTAAQSQAEVATAPDGEGEHGVEVASVNFGAHMGSIFYVPSGSIEANRTTTVVWLADDAGE